MQNTTDTTPLTADDITGRGGVIAQRNGFTLTKQYAGFRIYRGDHQSGEQLLHGDGAKADAIATVFNALAGLA